METRTFALGQSDLAKRLRVDSVPFAPVAPIAGAIGLLDHSDSRLRIPEHPAILV